MISFGRDEVPLERIMMVWNSAVLRPEKSG